MKKALWIPIVAAAMLSACSRTPEPHGPPSQKDSLLSGLGGPVTTAVNMEDPNSSNYVVSGFAPSSEGPWRWAYEHPKLRFWGPDSPKVSFMMEYSVPERSFRHTGPITLTLIVNGVKLDTIKVGKAGPATYTRELPDGMLKRNAMNEVAIEPDKTYAPPDDNAKYSFILVRAGFVD